MSDIQLVKLAPNKITYNNNIQVFNASTKVHSDCNEITFINNSTTNTALLNGSLLLAPGDSIGFDGKQYEWDTTIYDIVCAGAGNNSVVVIRKFYNN